MPLGRGEVFAGYTIVRLLGSGGMSEVYLAEHPRLPRHDALKVLRADVSVDPEFRSRFNREADLAASLFHPHIVGVHDRGEFEGQLWIAMDYVGGTDAGALVQQAKVNSAKQFVESPDFDDAVKGAVADNQGAHEKLSDYFFTNAPGRAHLISDIAKWFYQEVVDQEGKVGLP